MLNDLSAQESSVSSIEHECRAAVHMTSLQQHGEEMFQQGAGITLFTGEASNGLIGWLPCDPEVCQTKT